MFHILDPNNSDDFSYLAKMHHLRYNVFYKSLKWEKGLRIHSQMEFDEYDHEDARYLVHIDANNNVNACARLTPTDKPYLLGHSFPEFIDTESVPVSPDTFEISRLCADSKTAPRKATGLLMAAMLEYGLQLGIKSYVSLSDVKIMPLVRRFGWQSQVMGAMRNTGTDISAALKYNVTETFHDQVKQIVGVTGSSFVVKEKNANDNWHHLQIEKPFG